MGAKDGGPRLQDAPVRNPLGRERGANLEIVGQALNKSQATGRQAVDKDQRAGETDGDVKWNNTHTWGEVYRQNEVEYSKYNFESAPPDLLLSLFNSYEKEAIRLLEEGLVYPGYDHTIKCSHIFNLLEARGTISISERAKYIGRVRALANQAAELYLRKSNEQTTIPDD